MRVSASPTASPTAASTHVANLCGLGGGVRVRIAGHRGKRGDLVQVVLVHIRRLRGLRQGDRASQPAGCADWRQWAIIGDRCARISGGQDAGSVVSGRQKCGMPCRPSGFIC